MAQQIQTLFIDDIDGGPAEGTVREWAEGEGIDIKERGRVPAEVIEKYKAAGV